MAMIEKATYIKGLCDGMELDSASKEGKVIAALLDLVTEMASAIDEMKGKMSDLEDYIEEIDEDLGDVEEFLYDDECDCCCDDDCDCDCCCDDDYVEVECPGCGEVICLDDSVLDEETIKCPACGELLEFEFDDECDCDECDE